MRFLYGDSAPFPLGYNFLATLEVFMAAATRVVQLETESRELARQTDEVAQSRVKGLEALEQFHTVVMRAVQDTAQKVQHAHALEYAQRVAEFASRHVDEHRRAVLGASEREVLQVRNDNEHRTSEQRAQIEGFLKVAKLPVLATKVSMRLAVDGKDTRHQIHAVFDNPDGIQTAFALNASKVAAWAMPRKVADFAQGTELLVGVDKSWLRGTVTAKQVNVDDWTVTQFDLGDDSFELTIKRKLVEKESLFFRLRRGEAGLSGVVEHPGQVDARPAALGQSDLAALDRVWQAVRAACGEVLEHKEQLRNVSLDGAPVFDGGLVIPFVVRLVTMFAPTVREIAKRSPNEFELSLKQETEGGRREELYLRKEQLTSKLHPLSSVGREVFAPLGLDSWVPGVTTAPPPVVSGPPAPPGSSRTVPRADEG
ncbi:MAG: hypothetical protein KF819_17365 [Labilithrix sp.]|nr:hypothetical protein [Labilithrix sp.]